MSSSYRDSMTLRHKVRGVLALVGAILTPVGLAVAADKYVQPQAEARVETNDNFNLVPGGSPDSNVYGYIADLQALIGIATERSDTSLRPRVKFQEYPDRDDIDKVEGFLDLRSKYDWERSQLLTIGRYSQQDAYNSEFASGEFDPLDPDAPTEGDSGLVVFGETRTMVELRPTFSHAITERTKAGVEAQYRAVRYDSDSIVNEHTDFDFLYGLGFLSWALDPRSDVSVGAYVSKYSATDDSSETDAYGGEVGYGYRWSDTMGITATVTYESNDITDNVPVRQEESTSGWGGEFTGYRTTEVSSLRVAVGRSFIPTGDGGKAESDQLRLQYDRDLNERLSLLGVARYESRNSISTVGRSSDRDYARVDLSVKWLMTPTWFLQGGYSYIWQDRESASGDAANNKIFATVGYKGLGRQRR